MSVESLSSRPPLPVGDEEALKKALAEEGMEMKDVVPPRPMQLSDILIIVLYHMLPFTMIPISLIMLTFYFYYKWFGWLGPVAYFSFLYYLSVIPRYYKPEDRKKLRFLYEALCHYMLSMKCIVPTEPGPAQGYIWAMHPHGRMFYTPSMLVQLSDVFRGHLCPTGDIFGMAASGFFNAPFVRSLFFFIGALPANKSDIVGCLRNKDHVALVPGGVKEVCLGTNAHTDKLYLNKRKGFIKIAMEEKVGVIPVYFFNENQLFKHDPKWYLKMCEVINNYVNIGVPFMRGVWNLPMPFRRHILIVVGKPIFHKEGETLDEFHARYIEYVKALYDRYAPVSPRPQQKLIVV